MILTPPLWLQLPLAQGLPLCWEVAGQNAWRVAFWQLAPPLIKQRKMRLIEYACKVHGLSEGLISPCNSVGSSLFADYTSISIKLIYNNALP